MFFKIKKLPLISLNLIFCNLYITQIIIIENIDNIMKGTLEVLISVCVYKIVDKKIVHPPFNENIVLNLNCRMKQTGNCI